MKESGRAQPIPAEPRQTHHSLIRSFGFDAVQVQLHLKLFWLGSSSNQHDNQLRLENTTYRNKNGTDRDGGFHEGFASLSFILPRIRAPMHSGTALCQPFDSVHDAMGQSLLRDSNTSFAHQLQPAACNIAESDARTAAGHHYGKSVGCCGP